MKSQTEPLALQIPSNLSISLSSLVAALAVLSAALLLQWLIYDDWLHRGGSVRMVGSVLASGLTFLLVFRWRSSVRERRIEMLQRFETIARMNDRIRNALQIIECATYASNPEATAPVKNAVDVIEAVLSEVLVESHPAPPPTQGEEFSRAAEKRNSA